MTDASQDDPQAARIARVDLALAAQLSRSMALNSRLAARVKELEAELVAARLDAMTDDDINAAAVADPDNPPMTQEELARVAEQRLQFHPTETVIGADGLSRPITMREVAARAALHVLQHPDGVETLDWQIADAVIAALFVA
jgi:hypothetical protein